MNEEINKIMEELKTAGANENEAEELAYFSKNLSNVLSFERSVETKNRFLEKVESMSQIPSGNFFVNHRSLFASVLGVILLLGFATIVSAQDSLPGQPLYSVKRITEEVVSTVNPSFNAEILKRRSVEIKILTKPSNTNIDSSKNVQSAIKDYEIELNDHKNINSKIVEESKTNLLDAKEQSSDGNKKEIEDVIKKTETKYEDVKGESITPAPVTHESRTSREDRESVKEDSSDR